MKLGIGRHLLSLYVTTALATMALAACCPPPDPKTVTVVCESDAGASEEVPFEADQSPEAVARTSPCSRACAALSLIGCPESVQLPGGDTCVVNCNKLVKISTFDPECIAAAKSATAVRKCPQIVCQKK